MKKIEALYAFAKQHPLMYFYVGRCNGKTRFASRFLRNWSAIIQAYEKTEKKMSSSRKKRDFFKQFFSRKNRYCGPPSPSLIFVATEIYGLRSVEGMSVEQILKRIHKREIHLKGGSDNGEDKKKNEDIFYIIDESGSTTEIKKSPQHPLPCSCETLEDELRFKIVVEKFQALTQALIQQLRNIMPDMLNEVVRLFTQVVYCCAPPQVVHQIKHGRKARTRKKNRRRAIKSARRYLEHMGVEMP